MNEKYCILENDGVALCICKHKPCVLIKRMQEQYKNAINENRLLKAELEQYKKSKQASYETMQAEWNNAVNKLRDAKVENEKLKETAEGLLKIQYALADSCNKYCKALENIKKYIKDNNLYRGIEVGYIRCDIELLDKINEGLND